MLNPIHNTTREKNDGGYDADSGLDILCPVGTPVHAAKSGYVIYAEHGHTPWIPNASHPHDTPNSILIKTDQVTVGPDGIEYPFNWYTHLSKLYIHVPDGTQELHVNAGDLLGWSGIGNSIPHLHFGVVQDRAQTVTMPQKQIASILWSSKYKL